MDRGSWWATVHGITKSHTQLKQLRIHACTVETKETKKQKKTFGADSKPSLSPQSGQLKFLDV